ncbi:MAG: flagellar biosynthetic protein FliO [Pseudomonadales bacterium]
MEPSWASHSLDMLGALLGVLLLILAVAWLLKRVQLGQASGRSHLRIVSVLPLSAKERVVLLQAGSEQVLMGVSGAGIQHLHTLKEPVSLAPENHPGRNDKPLDSGGFAAHLKSLMQRSGT